MGCLHQTSRLRVQGAMEEEEEVESFELFLKLVVVFYLFFCLFFIKQLFTKSTIWLTEAFR